MQRLARQRRPRRQHHFGEARLLGLQLVESRNRLRIDLEPAQRLHLGHVLGAAFDHQNIANFESCLGSRHQTTGPVAGDPQHRQAGGVAEPSLFQSLAQQGRVSGNMYDHQTIVEPVRPQIFSPGDGKLIGSLDGSNLRLGTMDEEDIRGP